MENEDKSIMEYVAIPSSKICPNYMLEKFIEILPKEFKYFTEIEASSMLESEMKSLLGSNDLFQELQKDCSLDNLYIDADYPTLDEILQVLPQRKTEPLYTLKALPTEPVAMVNSRNTLCIRHRLYRPQVDLSYLNAAEGCLTETSLPTPEIILSVFVYRPLPADADISNAPWKIIMDQKIEILGCQSLTNLHDAIKCPQDKVCLGDCSESLDNLDVHIPAEIVYTSSYFFIENIFYDDLRNPNSKKLSECIINWHKSRITAINDKYSAASMDSVRLGDLNISLGKPYLFCHQGNCEHTIIFTNARLTDRMCAQSVSAYPIVTGRALTFVSHCEACKHKETQWLVYDAGDLLPRDPSPLCNHCLRHLLYDETGAKIDPNFRVQKYLGHEMMCDQENLAMNAQTFGILQEISSVLNTGLQNEELLACFKMLEDGADPTGLALLVRQLKQDAAKIQAEEQACIPSILGSRCRKMGDL